MTRYIGLVRGINVGGRSLPMATLRDVVAQVGGTDVATYIQSGNVVFDLRGRRSDDALAASIAAGIDAAVGFEPRVMVRRASEWQRVIDANPYPVTDPTKVHVAILSGAPARGRVQQFDRERYLPEEFTVVGHELFLHVPGGLGTSKLAPALGALGVDMTVRNWRTVLKLAEMAAAD